MHAGFIDVLTSTFQVLLCSVSVLARSLSLKLVYLVLTLFCTSVRDKCETKFKAALASAGHMHLHMAGQAI